MQPITRATIRALPRCALGFRLRACPSQALERTSFGCNYHHKASNLPLNTALAQCRRVNSSARCTSQDGAEVGSGGDGAQSPGGILLYELESKRLIRISSVVAVVSGVYWTTYLSFMESLKGTPGLESEPWGVLGIGMTGLLMTSSYVFADKLVGRIWYHPDSHSLSISTHSFSSREKVPRNVKVGTTTIVFREGKHVYMPFKAKGDYAYSLLDLNDGIFHNKDLLIQLLQGNISVDLALAMSRGEEEGDKGVDGGPSKFKFKYGKKSKVVKRERERERERDLNRR